LKKSFLVGILVVLLAASACVSAESYGQESTYFSSIPSNAQIDLVSFTPSATSILQGSSIDFSIVASNRGSLSSNVTAYVFFLDSNEKVVKVISFPDTVISPLEITTMIASSVSLSELSAGTYTLHANLTYTNGGETANTLNQTLTIISTPTNSVAASSGSSGGSSGGVSVGIIPISVTGNVAFSRKPVLIEVTDNFRAVLNLAIKNNDNKAITTNINISGEGAKWFEVTYNQLNLLPGEKRNIDLAISIPNAVPIGDYLAQLNILNADQVISKDFILIRVKSIQLNTPIVLKTITLDLENNRTLTQVSVKNPFETKFDLLQIRDTLPSSIFAPTMQVTFGNLPGKIIAENGLKQVMFEFNQLIPNQVIITEYAVNSLLSDYNQYSKATSFIIFNPKLTTSQDLFKIANVRYEPISTLQSGKVFVTIIYAGSKTTSTKVGLTGQNTFEIIPTYQIAEFFPGQIRVFEFQLKMLEGSPKGAYSIEVFVDSDIGVARLPISIATTSDGFDLTGATLNVISNSSSFKLTNSTVTLVGTILIILIGYAGIKRKLRARKVNNKTKEGLSLIERDKKL